MRAPAPCGDDPEMAHQHATDCLERPHSALGGFIGKYTGAASSPPCHLPRRPTPPVGLGLVQGEARAGRTHKPGPRAHPASGPHQGAAALA